MSSQNTQTRNAQQQTSQQGGQFMSEIQLKDPSKLSQLQPPKKGQIKGLNYSFHARGDNGAKVVHVWKDEQSYNQAMDGQFGQQIQQALGSGLQTNTSQIIDSTTQ